MEPAANESWLRIELEADEDAPFTVMFEPTGMTYDLAAGQRISADVLHRVTRDIRIVNWTGGISVWAPGPVITRDADGNELHHLN
jgi:hypothetical protein